MNMLTWWYVAVGLAVMVGQVPAMWNVLGSDAITHLGKLPCSPIGKINCRSY